VLNDPYHYNEPDALPVPISALRAMRSAERRSWRSPPDATTSIHDRRSSRAEKMRLSGQVGDARTGWTGHLPPTLTETPEELAYELRAAEALLLDRDTAHHRHRRVVLSSLAFAYFYLRSVNSENLWRPAA